MVRPPGSRLVLSTLGMILLPVVALGQSRPQGGPGIPGALFPGSSELWSLFSPLADLPRGFPSAAAQFPGLLEGSEPRVGLFWSGANPGALPFEVKDARSDFGTGREGVTGDYHRPFDAGKESHTRVEASGWRALGSRGAGVASAWLDDASYRDGVFSDVVRPYGSSPYIVADTAGTDLDQLAAHLEAAGGWRLGPWGVGIGVGFQGQETNTMAAPVPRRGHSAGPGVSLGVVRELPKGNLRLGAFGRWQSLNESVRAHTVTASTRIYQINGFNEPPPQDVSGLYHRWSEREAWTVGAGLSGTTWQADWVFWGRRAQVDERHSNERISHPRTDAWRAWSTTLGGSFQRRLLGEGVLTATIRWSELKGEAEPAPSLDDATDPVGDLVVFRAVEEAVGVALDFRTPLGDGRWTVAAVLTLDQERRDRRDSRIGAGSDLDVRTLGTFFEVLRTVTKGFALSAGGAFLSYDPIGGIPDPSAMGPEYNRWIGPEMALLGTPATTHAFTVGTRWDPGAGRVIWLRLGSSSFGPGNPGIVLPLLPDGNRRVWNVSGGVTLKDP